jgi:hypothetical protein
MFKQLARPLHFFCSSRLTHAMCCLMPSMQASAAPSTVSVAQLLPTAAPAASALLEAVLVPGQQGTAGRGALQQHPATQQQQLLLRQLLWTQQLSLL